VIMKVSVAVIACMCKASGRTIHYNTMQSSNMMSLTLWPCCGGQTTTRRSWLQIPSTHCSRPRTQQFTRRVLCAVRDRRLDGRLSVTSVMTGAPHGASSKAHASRRGAWPVGIMLTAEGRREMERKVEWRRKRG
jgi:hypothetical protein